MHCIYTIIKLSLISSNASFNDIHMYDCDSIIIWSGNGHQQILSEAKSDRRELKDVYTYFH